jgi:hypothetical protein
MATTLISGSVVEKYVAAKNALVAKYTFQFLREDHRKKVDARILDLLISAGVPQKRAERYKSMLRETQYYGMAAIAMALLGIRPWLNNVLFKDRWETVENPLVALTDADKAIQMATNEILCKHRVLLSLSDDDRQQVRGRKRTEGKKEPREMN